MQRKTDKWPNFREKRIRVVDEYIKHKRRQREIEELLRIMSVRKMLNQIIENIKSYERARKEKNQIIWVIIKI